jgi:hypothetical protein
MQVGFVGSARYHFTEVHRSAFGRDGPKYIDKIFAAEPVRRVEMIEFGVNLDAALLAFNRGFATSGR